MSNKVTEKLETRGNSYFWIGKRRRARETTPSLVSIDTGNIQITFALVLVSLIEVFQASVAWPGRRSTENATRLIRETKSPHAWAISFDSCPCKFKKTLWSLRFKYRGIDINAADTRKFLILWEIGLSKIKMNLNQIEQLRKGQEEFNYFYIHWRDNNRFARIIIHIASFKKERHRFFSSKC